MPCANCGNTTLTITLDGAVREICPSCNIPERSCTWCRLPMTKKLVGNAQFVHYICPKCVFQHTSKYRPTSPASAPKT